jgi:hypothetical protein
MSDPLFLTNDARTPGRMVAETTKRTRLSGVCPDGEPCNLPVACSQQCSRLEGAEIAEDLRKAAAAAGGLKVT